MASIKIYDLQTNGSESFLNELTDTELAVQGGLSSAFYQFAEALLIGFAIYQIVFLVNSFIAQPMDESYSFF
jgi:hypothetical protein